MKFTLMSDMHINHPQPKTPYHLLEETVVVAGDTSNGLEGLKFLMKLRNKGYRVAAVDGNHEHYSNLSQGRSLEETFSRFTEEYPSFVKFNEGEPYFILRNGWYPVDDPQTWFNYMNDGRYGDFTGEEVTKRAEEDAAFVAQYLSIVREQGEKAVVVTHTAPCLDTLDKKYEGHYSNDWYWNPAMKSLLSEFKDTILCWCHGHTHSPADVMVDGVRVIANPRGYPGENPGWLPLTVEV